MPYTELLEIPEILHLQSAEPPPPEAIHEVQQVSTNLELLCQRAASDHRYLGLATKDYLKSRMRENRTSGSVRGSRQSLRSKNYVKGVSRLSTRLDRIFRLRHTVLFTGRADFLNATSPAFNKTRQIKHMSNVGIVGAGSVLAHQVFQRPVFRQTSAVGDIQLIFIYADLNGDAGLILLVAQCVQQGFPQGFLRHKVPFDPQPSPSTRFCLS